MRVVIVDTYYARFLRDQYAANPSLAGRSYREQPASLHEECLGDLRRVLAA